MWACCGRETPLGYIRKGTDANGRFYAHVSRLTWVWIVYVAPLGCGLKGGLSFGKFDTEAEAMDAADRYVVAHVDSEADVQPSVAQTRR